MNIPYFLGDIIDLSINTRKTTFFAFLRASSLTDSMATFPFVMSYGPAHGHFGPVPVQYGHASYGHPSYGPAHGHVTPQQNVVDEPCSELNELRTEFDELTEKYERSCTENNDLQKKLADAFERLATLQAKMLDVPASASTPIASVTDFEGQIKKLTDERNQAQQERDQIMQRARAIGDALKKYRGLLEQTVIQLSTEQQCVVQLRAELAAVKQQAISFSELANNAVAALQASQKVQEEDQEQEVQEKEQEVQEVQEEEQEQVQSLPVPPKSWFDDDEGVASTATTICSTPSAEKPVITGSLSTEKPTIAGCWASIAKKGAAMPDPEPLPQRPLWSGSSLKIKKSKQEKNQEKQMESKFAAIHVPSAFANVPLNELSTKKLLELVDLVSAGKFQSEYLESVPDMLRDLLENKHDFVELFTPSNDHYKKKVGEINVSTLVWYIKDAVFGWLNKHRSLVADELADQARSFIGEKATKASEEKCLKMRLFA